MWLEPEFLVTCEALKRAGRESQFGTGTRFSRGFADVGFEEFVVLPNGKMMSLFTGAQSEILDEHKGFFFEIPTIDQLLAELERRNEPVEEIKYQPSGMWQVKAKGVTAESREIAHSLAKCLLATYQR